jgi:hypothetical protein
MGNRRQTNGVMAIFRQTTSVKVVDCPVGPQPSDSPTGVTRLQPGLYLSIRLGFGLYWQLPVRGCFGRERRSLFVAYDDLSPTSGTTCRKQAFTLTDPGGGGRSWCNGDVTPTTGTSIESAVEPS